MKLQNVVAPQETVPQTSTKLLKWWRKFFFFFLQVGEKSQNRTGNYKTDRPRSEGNRMPVGQQREEKRWSVPGQLPLVDALLNSHPDNKRRHGRVSPVRVETRPKWDLFLTAVAFLCLLRRLDGVFVVVFACARLSFRSFKWFRAHLRERTSEMRARKMKIRIINPTYLLSRSNQLAEPERAFRLQNPVSRGFLRRVGRKKKNGPH